MKPIHKPSVTVVKNFPMPPEGVKNVVKATVILLGMSPEEAKVRSLVLLLLLLLLLSLWWWSIEIPFYHICYLVVSL